MVRDRSNQQNQNLVFSTCGLLMEDGATMLEYVLIVASLAIVCVSSVSYAGAEVRQTFMTVRAVMAGTNIFPPTLDLPALPE